MYTQVDNKGKKKMYFYSQCAASPEGVPPLDKSEDGMGVYMVAGGESVSKGDGFDGRKKVKKSLDMELWKV